MKTTANYIVYNSTIANAVISIDDTSELVFSVSESVENTGEKLLSMEVKSDSLPEPIVLNMNNSEVREFNLLINHLMKQLNS